jgi:inosine/xanthosine triphosphatase
MKVVVGSKNPIKLASSEQAFSTYFPNETIEYLAAETESGVSEQPMSVEETIRGAVNRAMNACRPGTDFSVGIEGGLSLYDIDGQEHGIEISWACVYDCRTGVHELASSAGFPIFPQILDQIKAGKALSEAMHDEYGFVNLGQRNGYIGWLSNDVITRQSSNFEAVLLALSSLCKEEKSDLGT